MNIKTIINPEKIRKPLALLTMVVAIGAIAGGSSIVSAQVTTGNAASAQPGAKGGFRNRSPMVAGTVSSISGSTITITSTDKKSGTSTTYTVDASGATFHKSASGSTGAPVVATIADIAVGDSVMIRGTVSGTAVTATDVMDGVGPMMGGWGMGGNGGPMRAPMGASGTVSAVNGTSVTITNKDGTTYTIDASKAGISKVSTIAVSDIAVGDTISAEGPVSGTSIAASHITDGVIPFAGGRTNGNGSAKQ